MDLKPLLDRCKGQGTTTALVSLLGQRHPTARMLVADDKQARRLCAARQIPRTAIVTVHEAAQAFGHHPGPLFADTDVLWALQSEIDRLEGQVSPALAEARQLRDQNAAVQAENRRLSMKVNNLEADLDDLRNIRTNMGLLETENKRLGELETIVMQFCRHLGTEWHSGEALRHYGELQRRMFGAVGMEWPSPSHGASPDPPA